MQPLPAAPSSSQGVLRVLYLCLKTMADFERRDDKIEVILLTIAQSLGFCFHDFTCLPQELFNGIRPNITGQVYGASNSMSVIVLLWTTRIPYLVPCVFVCLKLSRVSQELCSRSCVYSSSQVHIRACAHSI